MKRLLNIVAALGLIVFVSCAHLPKNAKKTAEKRGPQTLVIALDGVPYDLIKKMHDDGYFQGFQEPSKVISTFPSTTTAAFGAMFHEVGGERPPGYDREYFSFKKRKIEGFLSELHPKSPRNFRNMFDYYRRSPFQKFWIYAAPGFSGHRDLIKIRHLLWDRPDRKLLLAYIGGTDGAGHILGGARVRHWLIYMDQFLQKMRKQYQEEFGEDLQMTLFSDHGFHYIRKPDAVPKRDLVQRLRKVGLSLSNNLWRKDHVVAIEWGNISGASVYVDESKVQQVAEILATTRGIDLVAYRSGENIEVLNYRNPSGDRAQVSCEAEGKRCRYEALAGDPLQYESVLRDFHARGRVDAQGYVSEDDWFQATKNHHYPDAPFRLYEAFFDLVTNPAPILFSTYPDYEYGDVRTRVGAWFHGGLKGTHGGLFQEASAAFVMTTDAKEKFPESLRYNEILPMVLGTHDFVCLKSTCY